MGQNLEETTVRIRGAQYQLRTDLPQATVQEMADYVDRTMNAIDPRASLPPGKISVLASLTIAGELMEAQRRLSDRGEEVERRVGRLNRMLDAALEGDIDPA